MNLNSGQYSKVFALAIESLLDQGMKIGNNSLVHRLGQLDQVWTVSQIVDLSEPHSQQTQLGIVPFETRFFWPVLELLEQAGERSTCGCRFIKTRPLDETLASLPA